MVVDARPILLSYIQRAVSLLLGAGHDRTDPRNAVRQSNHWEFSSRWGVFESTSDVLWTSWSASRRRSSTARPSCQSAGSSNYPCLSCGRPSQNCVARIQSRAALFSLARRAWIIAPSNRAAARPRRQAKPIRPIPATPARPTASTDSGTIATSVLEFLAPLRLAARRFDACSGPHARVDDDGNHHAQPGAREWPATPLLEYPAGRGSAGNAVRPSPMHGRVLPWLARQPTTSDRTNASFNRNPFGRVDQREAPAERRGGFHPIGRLVEPDPRLIAVRGRAEDLGPWVRDRRETPLPVVALECSNSRALTPGSRCRPAACPC
jgi:hypothetical protein